MAVWDLNDIARLHLPPEEEMESGSEDEAVESDIDEEYIEPPKTTPPEESSESSESSDSDDSDDTENEDDESKESKESKETKESDDKSEDESDDENSSSSSEENEEESEGDDDEESSEGSKESEDEDEEESESSESSGESEESKDEENSEELDSDEDESQGESGDDSEELDSDDDEDSESSEDDGESEEESKDDKESGESEEGDESETDEPEESEEGDESEDNESGESEEGDESEEESVENESEEESSESEESESESSESESSEDNESEDESSESQEDECEDDDSDEHSPSNHEDEENNPDYQTPDEDTGELDDEFEEENDLVENEIQDLMRQEMEDIDDGTISEDDLKALSDELIESLNEMVSGDTYSVHPDVRDDIFTIGDTPDNIEAGEKEVGPSLEMLGTLAKRLRYLFTSRDSTAVQGGLRKGPRLDGRNIHKIISGKKGQVPPIFAKKTRGSNVESVVSIMVDNSGSMNSGMKDVYAQRMCIGLGTTLARMGIPFEIMGFTSAEGGRGVGSGQTNGQRLEPVGINKIKLFEETFKPHKALFPSSRAASNADMEVMDIMIKRLQERKEPKKIFFGISDGMPCHNGYSNYYELYKAMIDDAKSEGIHIFGFGIGDSARVEQFYGSDHSTTISKHNVSEFPVVALKKLTEILGRS